MDVICRVICFCKYIYFIYSNRKKKKFNCKNISKLFLFWLYFWSNKCSLGDKSLFSNILPPLNFWIVVNIKFCQNVHETHLIRGSAAREEVPIIVAMERHVQDIRVTVESLLSPISMVNILKHNSTSTCHLFVLVTTNLVKTAPNSNIW